MEPQPHRRMSIWICAALVLATCVTFWPALRCDFINYDDPDYVTANSLVQRGLTARGVVWAFTTNHVANWHPLTWLSHMLDCQLFGVNPAAHHAVNLLLHAASVVLLFVLLIRTTGAAWRSAIATALFALHPLRVESVAWVAERKDTLAALFWLLTVWAYVRYVEERKSSRFALVLASFALGLMAKPMLVTLPFALLLLDCWPLKRNASVVSITNGGRLAGLLRQWRPLLIEKWPLFALALVSSLVTFLAQKSGGTVASVTQLSLGARFGNAVISYVRYLGKLIWPTDLAVIYPYPAAWLGWQIGAAIGVLAAISALAWLTAKRRPYLLVGWLWFLGTLVPVIGLVQVGRQAIADRYTYIPMIGLGVMLVWGAADLLARVRRGELVGGVLAALALTGCALATRQQLSYWKDGCTLFTHTLAVTKDNALAQNNLGTALAALGRRDEALLHYAEAVLLQPADPVMRNNFGAALAKAGRIEAAMEQYGAALQAKPGFDEAHNNLGAALVAQGRLDEAILQFRQALAARPDYAEAHNNLGGVLAMQQKHAEAVEHYAAAIRLSPDAASGHLNYALSLEKLGRADDALNQFSEAFRLDPRSTEAAYNLGRFLVQHSRFEDAIIPLSEAIRTRPEHARAQFYLGLAQISAGRTGGGIAHLREAVRLRPDWPEALNALAWQLAISNHVQPGDAEEAVHLAEKAVSLAGGQPVFLGTLAAAYANAERFTDADQTAAKAIEQARANGQTTLATDIARQQEVFKAGRPFRPEGR